MEKDKFYAIVFSGEYADEYSIEDIYYSKSVAEAMFQKKLYMLRERSGWREEDELYLLSMPMSIIDEAEYFIGRGTSAECSKFVDRSLTSASIIECAYIVK